MQPLISPDKPLQFDSDINGLFGAPRYGFVRAANDAQQRDETVFGRLCRNGDRLAKAGFVASMGFLALTIAYGLVLNGAAQSLSGSIAAAGDNAARNAGLVISRIVVAGRVQLSEADVIQALGSIAGQSILAFDTRAAKDRLLEIGWVRGVEIQRSLPSTLQIELVERTPFAVWRSADKTLAVDAEGVVLGPVKPDELSGLPRIAGEGAPSEAKSLMDALAPFPGLKQHLAVAERIGTRRWDLVLKNGFRAKLAATDMPGALAALNRFVVEHGGFLGDIAVADLRAAGQVALQLKPASKGARQRLMALAPGP